MASYHCPVKPIKPSRGQSARAHCDYIMRTGKYGRKDSAAGEVLAAGTGGLPTWASSIQEYFRSADLLETAGKLRGRQAAAAKAKAEAEGREYIPESGQATSAMTGDIALPAELTDSQREDLARAIMAQLATTEDGRTLPHAWAIHKPPRPDSLNHHLHWMIGTRAESATEAPRPDAVSFFAPPRKGGGGARKVKEQGSRAWLKQVRAMVADLQNEALAAAGHSARVDHRSLKDQGIDREARKRLPRGQWEAQAAEAAALEAHQAAEAAEEQARQAERWQEVEETFLKEVTRQTAEAAEALRREEELAAAEEAEAARRAEEEAAAEEAAALAQEEDEGQSGPKM